MQIHDPGAQTTADLVIASPQGRIFGVAYGRDHVSLSISQRAYDDQILTLFDVGKWMDFYEGTTGWSNHCRFVSLDDGTQAQIAALHALDQTALVTLCNQLCAQIAAQIPQEKRYGG